MEVEVDLEEEVEVDEHGPHLRITPGAITARVWITKLQLAPMARKMLREAGIQDTTVDIATPMAVAIIVVRQDITRTNVRTPTNLAAVLVEAVEEAEVEAEEVVEVAEVGAKPLCTQPSQMPHRCQPPLPTHQYKE